MRCSADPGSRRFGRRDAAPPEGARLAHRPTRQAPQPTYSRSIPFALNTAAAAGAVMKSRPPKSEKRRRLPGRQIVLPARVPARWLVWYGYGYEAIIPGTFGV